MNEVEKMIKGKLYDPEDKTLREQRKIAHKLSKDYNDTYDFEIEKRSEIISKLIPNFGKGSYLQGPIQIDYGIYTSFGENCFANFGLVILDCCHVNIGDNVFFGPGCTIATPMHPFLASERNRRPNSRGELYPPEYAKPITIESDCWLSSGVIICGGVTIGRGTVIGAGSVVTRDIPSGVLAVGNPCRVIRRLSENDSIFKKKDLF